MRVATKTALGSLVLMISFVGVLLYLLERVDRLAEINRELTAIQFSAVRYSLSIFHAIDQLEEYARKYFVSGDEDYRVSFVSVRDTLDDELRALNALDLTGTERGAAGRLARDWSRYLEEASLKGQVMGLDKGASAPEAFVKRLRHLRKGVHDVMSATEEGIRHKARVSTEANHQARVVSWQIGGAGLVICVLILVLMMRAINRPLRQLSSATRAVSRGCFSIRVETAPSGDEFAELASAFNHMVHSLGELDQLKKDFISQVSHELKTPLVAMQETNKLLLEEIPGPLTAKQRRFLELNIDGSKRLSSMIGKLLELSRLEAGVQNDLRSHDLLKLASRSAAELEARARDQGIHFQMPSTEHLLPVLCDGDRIIQVIQNLLENALKYSPPQSEVTIQIAKTDNAKNLPQEALCQLPPADRDKNVYLRLSVSDAGPGIPEEDRQRVFERFYRISNAERKDRGGVGLGLTICREIIHSHKGAIWLATSHDSGATFSFILPTIAMDPAEPPPSNSPGHASKGNQ